jgi:ATP-dependent exoDNAse (exonuclease V) alpha subunit
MNTLYFNYQNKSNELLKEIENNNPNITSLEALHGLLEEQLKNNHIAPVAPAPFDRLWQTQTSFYHIPKAEIEQATFEEMMEAEIIEEGDYIDSLEEEHLKAILGDKKRNNYLGFDIRDLNKVNKLKLSYKNLALLSDLIIQEKAKTLKSKYDKINNNKNSIYQKNGVVFKQNYSNTLYYEENFQLFKSYSFKISLFNKVEKILNEEDYIALFITETLSPEQNTKEYKNFNYIEHQEKIFNDFNYNLFHEKKKFDEKIYYIKVNELTKKLNIHNHILALIPTKRVKSFFKKLNTNFNKSIDIGKLHIEPLNTEYFNEFINENKIDLNNTLNFQNRYILNQRNQKGEEVFITDPQRSKNEIKSLTNYIFKYMDKEGHKGKSNTSIEELINPKTIKSNLFKNNITLKNTDRALKYLFKHFTNSYWESRAKTINSLKTNFDRNILIKKLIKNNDMEGLSNFVNLEKQKLTETADKNTLYGALKDFLTTNTDKINNWLFILDLIAEEDKLNFNTNSFTINNFEIFDKGATAKRIKTKNETEAEKKIIENISGIKDPKTNIEWNKQNIFIKEYKNFHISKYEASIIKNRADWREDSNFRLLENTWLKNGMNTNFPIDKDYNPNKKINYTNSKLYPKKSIWKLFNSKELDFNKPLNGYILDYDLFEKIEDIANNFYDERAEKKTIKAKTIKETLPKIINGNIYYFDINNIIEEKKEQKLRFDLDLTFLTYTNLTRNKINRKIQKYLNKNSFIPNTKLKIEDKIIFTDRNGEKTETNKLRKVFNIQKQDQFKIIEAIDNMVILEDEDLNILILPIEILYKGVELAYSITIHNSQGKSIKNTCLIQEDYKNFNIDLFYTATSRATETLTILLNKEVYSSIRYLPNGFTIIDNKIHQKTKREFETIKNFKTIEEEAEIPYKSYRGEVINKQSKENKTNSHLISLYKNKNEFFEYSNILKAQGFHAENDLMIAPGIIENYKEIMKLLKTRTKINTNNQILIDNINLNKEQIEARNKALNNGFTIISGQGGSGKTYTLKNIYENLIANGINKDEIVLSAFTNTATQILKEQIGGQAKTIHSLISHNGNASLIEDNSLNYKYLIIDEASMVDFELLKQVIKKTSNDTRIILIGDHKQLKPVNGISALEDLIKYFNNHTTILKANNRTNIKEIKNFLEEIRTF